MAKSLTRFLPSRAALDPTANDASSTIRMFQRLAVGQPYDITAGDWPEIGRVDEALGELVVNWHCLTPSVRDAIVALVRSCEM